MIAISKYFTLEEATRSDIAARLSIDNTPNADQLAHIKFAATQLDVLRDYLKAPLRVSSWLRTPALNSVTPGSSATSAHQYGYAIDCYVTGMTALDLCKRAVDCLTREAISWDQIIHEFGDWMHLSFDPRGRRELLTMFSGTGYLSGLLTEQEARHV